MRPRATMKNTLLIIDDEKDIRHLLAKLLEYEGYEVLTTDKAKSGLQLLQEQPVQVVLCDVKLPDANGIALVKEIKTLSPETEVICLTAYGTIQDGVQAMKNGAFDYLVKGDDNNKIIPMVSKAEEKARLQFRIRELERRVAQTYDFDQIIGHSSLLQAAVQLARKVAPSEATVLLTGPTGTGKEVFAHAIHAASTRRHQAFVVVNCSAFGRDLLESELFGYRTGAFTGATKDKKGLFEEAHRGTLFLDEIGELNLDLQAKLLRVLESGAFLKVGDTKETQVDVRVIAATNRRLEEESLQGKFREDLFYRLSVFQLKLPSLNERTEDIPLLTEHFAAQFGRKTGKKINHIDRAYLEALKKHTWRGNIRELRNLVERSVILADGDTLTKDLLPLDFEALRPGVSTGLFDLHEVERRHIQQVLQHVHGNKTKAAALLGIGLSTLYRRMEEDQIEG
ncbi:DNA-binding transcriptional response regulator, NtrC family, contains REC, AAA-type ATPase, and a Fis-type DNA-binding domains [Catalinimonas alkaloidigena]|uniref:DNA-binding transcriptional response regulator, NtrC family, contains REC, AAA-type ATPase, and a Fis-type DNA-binding domains n=1 Tax=Catalinimonas alkaloidigena TaxID=1075417 RepID=A0A1G8YBX7_9BACT|nr:sigma-54 dependent transcriptional regulator [Catalinimonas alkaloidigena]SDJ99745.1 DNA-binding transcriptional response regulator, NtrC family, contains REC, AAA-type ATPase, and a Fis-type DNA-binding domains [Catalinimonas alkaloidigena]